MVLPLFLTLILFSIGLLCTILGTLALIAIEEGKIMSFACLLFGIICFVLLYLSNEEELKSEQWSYEELTIVSHYPSYSTYYFDGHRRTKYDGEKVFLSNGDSTVIGNFNENEMFEGATVVYLKCVSSCVRVSNGWGQYFLGSIKDESELAEFVDEHT